MKKSIDEHKAPIDDESKSELWTEKRARQACFRELVRTGQRTQESGFLIAPEIARTLKVRRRTEEF